jgi:hypothetical protein
MNRVHQCNINSKSLKTKRMNLRTNSQHSYFFERGKDIYIKPGTRSTIICTRGKTNSQHTRNLNTKQEPTKQGTKPEEKQAPKTQAAARQEHHQPPPRTNGNRTKI